MGAPVKVCVNVQDFCLHTCRFLRGRLGTEPDLASEISSSENVDIVLAEAEACSAVQPYEFRMVPLLHSKKNNHEELSVVQYGDPIEMHVIPDKECGSLIISPLSPNAITENITLVRHTNVWAKVFPLPALRAHARRNWHVNGCK